MKNELMIKIKGVGKLLEPDELRELDKYLKADLIVKDGNKLGEYSLRDLKIKLGLEEIK